MPTNELTNSILSETKKISPTTSYSRIVLNLMRERQHEKHISNEAMIEHTKTTRTTYYRVWNSKDDDIQLNLDFTIRCCRFLELPLDPIIKELADASPAALPMLEDSHQEITTTAADVLVERKDTINEQEQIIASLNEKLEAKENELRKMQDEHIERITSMSADIKALYDQMHDLNREHRERVDELINELNQRDRQLYALTQSYMDAVANLLKHQENK